MKSNSFKMRSCCLSFIFSFFLFGATVTLAAPFKQILPQQELKSDIVEVVSTGMNFNLPKQIPSGWTTFRYKNESPDVHFFVLEKMPDGKNIEDTRKEVVPVFQSAMDLITAGNSEQGFAEFSNLPAWFFDVQFTGGPGLISPAHMAQTTVHLEPGTYLLECYVKMPNGQFHSALGMLEEIEVVPEQNSRAEPNPDCSIKISSTEGIEYKDIVLPGKYTFAVEFMDQMAHENFVGQDVHLVRLTDEANLKELNTWMNWAAPASFTTPAPKGVQFLGGTQEMPAGETSYFTATLRPGNYALIAEIPDPLGKNMLKTFRVPGIGKKLD